MAIKPNFKHRFWKNDGTVNAGGKVWTYVVGTTTPTPTYTDSGAGTPNANPIILDSKGEAEIWVVGQIKVNVLESDNTQVTGWPVDNIGAGVTDNDATSRWSGTAAGTANALTISPSPSISAYAIGQSFIFKSGAATNTGATTISVSGLSNIAVQSNGVALSGGEILANSWYHGVLSATNVMQISIIGAATFSTSYIAQDFRLSLTTGVPVTTADVTGATTICAVPRTGNRIGLFDGTIWRNYTSAGFSLALGTLTSGKLYDIFCYQNAVVPTLEFLVWTNGTTRATALAYNNGILVKSGDATRRYLGTFKTTSTTQTEDSVLNRYLSNYYHRAWREMRKSDTTDSWTYTTDTFRQANNSATNQLNFIIGVAEDMVTANVISSASSDASNPYILAGIGLDSVTAGSSNATYTTARPTYPTTTLATYSGVPSAGEHYLAWLERSQAVGTTTWYGDAGLTGGGSSSIYGGLWS